MNRGIVAEINLKAISNNLSIIKSLSSNRTVIAVVKADAYGHGAVEVSRSLVSHGIGLLAVAFTGEAKELREAGINAPILVLFDPDIEDIFNYNITPVITSKKTAVAISREAEKTAKKINVHIKVDTGMGRLGITGDAAKEILEIASLKGINIEGIMSHFSEADLADPSFVMLQIDRFSAIQNELYKNGLKVKLFHIANSAAVLTIPESHFDAVRPGLMLYGYSPLKKSDVNDSKLLTPNSELIPAMSVKARIITIRKLPPGTPISYGRTYFTKRDSLIGVISVGYADGFSTSFSNNAEVLVKGNRVPIVGRVCMDLTMIDLTDLEDVTEDDEVVIMGRQGNESIYAPELARRADTIPYEILTSLGNKAKKKYIY